MNPWKSVSWISRAIRVRSSRTAARRRSRPVQRTAPTATSARASPSATADGKEPLAVEDGGLEGLAGLEPVDLLVAAVGVELGPEPLGLGGPVGAEERVAEDAVAGAVCDGVGGAAKGRAREGERLEGTDLVACGVEGAGVGERALGLGEGLGRAADVEERVGVASRRPAARAGSQTA